MKQDVLQAYLQKTMPPKRPSKETLNHAGLIFLASGIDPYQNTQAAYMGAYKSLGIDVLNRVPSSHNVRRIVGPGESAPAPNGYTRAYLGLYDTFFRHTYPIASVDDFFETEHFDFDYSSFITPVPHRLDADLIRQKELIAGDIGCYYYQYYLTLFMWAVEYLGWETFMIAAMEDPEFFDEHFLQKAFETTMRDIEPLLSADVPFVWLHDDLASAQGPMFHPDWYEKYIFPRYEELFDKVHKADKLVIHVADGNMGCFLQRLYDLGADGVMVENPATDFNLAADIFSDRILISGMETVKLSIGSVDEIYDHVKYLAQRTADMPGFTITSPGGLHNNIPLENLIAYFDARVEFGFTPPGWIKGDIKTAQSLIP